MNTYTFQKDRSTFGRQCIFASVDFDVCEIEPDDDLKNTFIWIKTSKRDIQSCQQMAVTDVSTDDANMHHIGINHYEGGWPNYIDLKDDNNKSQYVQKSQETEIYQDQLKQMCMNMEHKIAQNNTCNLFEEYFTNEKSTYQSFKPQIESISMFENPFKMQNFDTIASHSSIAPISQDKIVVSYTTQSIGQMTVNQFGLSSYIWDLNRNLHPILELECSKSLSLSTVEYNLKNEFNIAAGRSDGTVVLYDSRSGGKATIESIREQSHRESVRSLNWTASKANAEFFTTANDAMVMSWDIRNMNKPIELYQLELNGAGCSTADYSFTIPTRFLIGTTNGCIINGNKREQAYEKRFPYIMKSFSGPVQTIERNPFADKYSLCVGDQSIRFWSDEDRETPIIQTHEYSHELTCGTWNRNRCSNFFIGHENGTIDVWDLLYDHFQPIASISIGNSPVQHLRSHSNGRLLITCYKNGDIHLMQISEFLSSHKIIEKAKLIEILDRELKREIVFLTKLRELKQQTVPTAEEPSDGDEQKKLNPEILMKQCIEDFENIIQKASPKGNK